MIASCSALMVAATVLGSTPAAIIAWVLACIASRRRLAWLASESRSSAAPAASNTPTRRWFITPDGRRYLANGLRPDAAVARDRQRQERQAEKQRIEEMLAATPRLPPGPERTARMRELKAAGCTLGQIAAVFGVTHERAYQILARRVRRQAA
jgi:hypothetical protein